MKRLNLVILIFLIFLSGLAWAGWLGDTFIDPADNCLDMSSWLLEKEGFLPVPVIITEPAVGYGGGLAAVYFHDKIGAKKGTPPSVSVLVGAATENGTWLVGGGHLGIWADDNIRYSGGLGAGLIKMRYYGLPDRNGHKRNSGVHFETDAIFLTQEIQFRLWSSPFFAGISYTFIDTDNQFRLAPDEPLSDLPGIKFDSRTAAVSLMLNYDSRDNLFSPNRGTAAEIKVMDFNDLWGSDQNFWRYKASVLNYTTLNDRLVMGLRGDAELIDGNAPFYAYPYIDMRGVKALQFQGNEILLGEVELRWELTPRWSLVGFGGAGKAFNDGVKENSDIIYSRGLGIRYLIASKLGLQFGLDVAKGPDDTSIYIQFGGAWVMQ